MIRWSTASASRAAERQRRETRWAAGPGRGCPGPAICPPTVAFRALAIAALAIAAFLTTDATAPRVVQAAAPSAPASPPPGGFGVHLVRPGDTFFSLARRYGMSVEELAVQNAMSPTAVLLPGRGLWVPLEQAANARAAAPAPPITSPSTGGSNAPALSSAGVESNSEQTAGAPMVQTASVGAAASRTYVVQPGDTLYGIADRFGADVETLKTANGLPYDGSIRAGEILIVEGEGTIPQPVAVAPEQATGSAYGGARTTPIIVAAGDTLSDIAARYGTTAGNLARLNNISPDAIAAGQQLLVPRPGSGAMGRGGAKRIEVDVSDQRMYVWEGDELIYNWPASTGMAGYGTRRGTFAVQSKIPNAWSSAWQLWMPNWLGIYWAGGSENGIHALPIINGTRIWGGVLGTPISYGCVVIGTDESRLLFNWAEMGTTVDIHD